MTGPWPAPRATRPVDATVALPGSKSMTNRALVLAALADGPSLVRGPLRSRDTALMAAALRALGGTVVETAAGDWQVDPAPLRGPAHVDCGLAGTVMRFLPPVAALAAGTVVLDGDPRARERPLRPLLAALRGLGADVEDTGGGLPVTVHGRGGLAGGSVEIDASASSQFVSGLLLAAPRYADGLDVHHVGPPVPSQPHLDMTVEMLTAAGVTASAVAPDHWRVRPGRVAPRTWEVEPDLSGAAPFLAAALVTGGRVTVPRWPARTTQAGAALADLLARMGGEVARTPDGLTLAGGEGVHGLDADLHDVGELTPVLAALAALADGPSRLSGLAHLRGHETDRLAALATELGRLGAAVTETDDGLEIEPKPLSGGTFRTYDDHRMAMAGAVIGLAVDGVVLDDVTTTAKTLPDFPAMWARMLEPAR